MRPLSRGERVGVRGYGLSEGSEPLTRRCALTSPRWGEVRQGLGALPRWRRQGGSFGGAGPPARGFLGLSAILRTEARQRLVEERIALAGGFSDNVPFQALDMVDRRGLSAHQHA